MGEGEGWYEYDYRDTKYYTMTAPYAAKISPDTLDTLGVASGSNFPREIVAMYGDLFLVMPENTLGGIDWQNWASGITITHYYKWMIMHYQLQEIILIWVYFKIFTMHHHSTYYWEEGYNKLFYLQK